MKGSFSYTAGPKMLFLVEIGKKAGTTRTTNQTNKKNTILRNRMAGCPIVQVALSAQPSPPS